MGSVTAISKKDIDFLENNAKENEKKVIEKVR